MGGVVNAVSDAVDTIVDGTKKLYEISEDLVNLAITSVTVTSEVLYDTIIKGESFSDSIAEGINKFAGDIRDVYGSLLDDTLGIDDSKYFGLKGDFFSGLGMIVNDALDEHVTSTVGIAIIVATLAVAILFPPAYGLATAVTTAAFSVGVTSTFGLLAVWYSTLTIVSLGLSVITSGLIEGAVFAMYGNTILKDMYAYETAQEALRISNLVNALDGSIYDNLAGGWKYNSQFAGGVYFDAGNIANPTASVGGEFKLSPHLIRTEFGYIDSSIKNLAGDSGFNVVTMTSNPK